MSTVHEYSIQPFKLNIFAFRRENKEQLILPLLLLPTYRFFKASAYANFNFGMPRTLSFQMKHTTAKKNYTALKVVQDAFKCQFSGAIR